MEWESDKFKYIYIQVYVKLLYRLYVMMAAILVSASDNLSSCFACFASSV